MRFLNRSRFLSGIITFIFAGLFLNSGMISANAANDISVTMPTGDFYSETGSETVEEIKLSEEEYNELVGSNFRRARVRNASSGTSYYYNQLSSNDKLFYDALLSMARADKDAVSGFSFNGISSGNISLVYEGTKYLNDVDISSVRNALNFDHPEELEGMLHLPAHVVISSSSGGTVRYAYYCFFRRGSDYTGSQIAAMEDELQNALSNTYSSIALSGSDVDKELAIHDALIKKIEYDHECADNNSVYDVAHTAYGALVDGSAVCDGYSKAFKMLLQKAGIESHVVAGFGNGGGHAWSVVKLDSDYYEVDVTWDDQEKYSSALYYNMLSHDYFNRTTEDFKSHQFNVPGFKTNTTTHVRNEKYLGYLEPPVANGTAKSYANVKKVYKVTFEGVIDGAKVSTTYSDTYTYEGKIVKMPTSVSLTGYTFGGWYTQKSGGTVIDKNTVLTGPTTAYAHWISKNVKVTFDANGGTSTPDPVTIAGGTAIGTLPTTSRTGYDFDGWYDAKTGGNKVTTTTKINSDMTLYAHWTAKTVTVTLNDGSSTADTITVKYNGKYEGLPTSRTKTGYTFGGWYLESSYKTLITASSVVGNANNHTLYAKWTAINYTVTFDANGGTPTPDPVSITYGTAIGTLPSVSMYGYDFAGWYDAKSGGNKVTSSTKIYSNMTLYAHWTAKTVTVTLNDGSSTSDTITVKYNGKYEGLPTSRTRTGYTFGGWYLESTYKTLITASSVVGNANNHTLYAKWTAINYTVSFDANGGTPTPDPVSVTYGTAIGTLPSVSMYGYDFDGWYDAKTSGNKVTSSTKIYSNMTLYAHWTAKSITVTLDDGSSTSDTITVKYNGKYEGLPTSRTRTGYIFGGWYLESSYKTLITANSVVGNANNHTLYAQWKIATVTVAFHAEGTDKPYEELSAHFGDSFASVMKERGVPTLDGYDFAGWFTASEGGDEVTKEDIISSTDIQNLYAQWTPLPDPVEEETPGENDPPGSGSETPGDESETPGSETPGSGSETPGDESETPGIETPGSGSETPGDEIETPGSGSETPGSG
ncbi:InlB B-repeat-containing protein, partial [Butyrivibrio sp. VCD2006]|uniref:InlB B-repeat-containing protein n=1 Tax=Butyrivibrio sp. VCD2006 TaxID=1280664 RepID=UPI00055F2A32